MITFCLLIAGWKPTEILGLQDVLYEVEKKQLQQAQIEEELHLRMELEKLMAKRVEFVNGVAHNVY